MVAPPPGPGQAVKSAGRTVRILETFAAAGGGSDLVATLGPARGRELLCSSRVLSTKEAKARALNKETPG